MEIKVFNDVDVRNYTPTGSYPILIRALNPYYQMEGIPYPEGYKQQYRAVLDVYVDDVREETEEGKRVFKLFNHEMAQTIYQFVMSHEFDECVVHCSYGESRSPAIAIGIAHLKEEYGVEESLRNDPRYRPNELILDYMMNMNLEEISGNERSEDTTQSKGLTGIMNRLFHKKRK